MYMHFIIFLQQLKQHKVSKTIKQVSDFFLIVIFISVF